MASTRIYRTAGTPTSQKKATISFWAKMGNLTVNGHVFDTYTDSNNRSHIQFDDADKIDVRFKVSGSLIGRLVCTPKFRDPTAWYHIVVALDTTQATNTDRIKLYINGVQNVSANNGFSVETYPSQDADVNLSGTHTVGAYHDGGSPSLYFNGNLAHVHYADGYAYAASDFGETDSTSGIWKPKASPTGITYGTNGFFLKFENSGNMDLDSSGNNLSFTTAGTLTQNVDTPTNNSAVFNRADRHGGSTNNYGDYLSSGCTKITITSSQKGCLRSTIGVASGKWYWEAKVISKSKGFYGVCNSTAFETTGASIQAATTYSGLWYYENGPTYYSYNNSTNNTSIDSIANDDILGFALDMDNYAFYIHKNGTYMNSGSPTSGSSRTGSIAELFTYGRNVLTDNGEVFVNHYVDSSSGGSTVEYNFGSGFFGTTAVASANADANGHGAFEYSVPSGYYTLNTKNVKEFG